MNLRQLRHLGQMSEERQERWLAEVLVRKLEVMKKALALKDQERALEETKVKFSDLVNKWPVNRTIKEIKGVSFASVLRDDVLKYLEIEAGLDDFIWEAKRLKRTVVEARNEVVDQLLGEEK